MFLIETNNGKVGGTLKGKPHNDKKGNPVGGIKAVVTDNNKPVELEGGEVIINKAAAKKHWRTLSEINQSAGGGVPIQEPQFGKGGKMAKGGAVAQSITHNGNTYNVGDVGEYGIKNRPVTITKISAKRWVYFRYHAKPVTAYAPIAVFALKFRSTGNTDSVSDGNKKASEPTPQSTSKNTSATKELYLEVGDVFETSGGYKYKVGEMLTDQVEASLNGSTSVNTSFSHTNLVNNFTKGNWRVISTEKFSVGDVFINTSLDKFKIEEIDVIKNNVVFSWVKAGIKKVSKTKWTIEEIGRRIDSGKWVKGLPFAVNDKFKLAEDFVKHEVEYTIHKIDRNNQNVVIAWLDNNNVRQESDINYSVTSVSGYFNNGTWIKIESTEGLNSRDPRAWGGRFAVGDKVKIRRDMSMNVNVEYASPENDFVVASILYWKGGFKNEENPTGHLYTLNKDGGQWEGKDLELIGETVSQKPVSIPLRQKPTPPPKKAPVNYEQAMNNWVANTLINTQTVSGDMLKDTIVNNFSIAINNVTQ